MILEGGRENIIMLSTSVLLGAIYSCAGLLGFVEGLLRSRVLWHVDIPEVYKMNEFPGTRLCARCILM